MTAFMQPVSDFMTPRVHEVTADESVADADRIMAEAGVSCLAVVGRDGKAAGVVSHSDLLTVARALVRSTGRSALLEMPTMCVGDLMTPKLYCVAPDVPVREAAALMVKHQIHRLFVLENDKPVGVLSARDLMLAIMRERVTTPIAERMTTPVLVVEVGDPLGGVVDQLARARVTGLVVVEGEVPVGVLTQPEALAARHLPATAPVEQAMSHSILCLHPSTPMFRAAAIANATRARRVLAIDGRLVSGILTTLDFARTAAG